MGLLRSGIAKRPSDGESGDGAWRLVEGARLSGPGISGRGRLSGPGFSGGGGRSRLLYEESGHA